MRALQEAAVARDGLDCRVIKSRAVILAAHDDVVTDAGEAERKRSRRRLAVRRPCFGRLDPMVDGVAQYVHQRIRQRVQHVAVDQSFSSVQCEFHLFTGESAGLTNGALQARGEFGHGQHAAPPHEFALLGMQAFLRQDQIGQLGTLSL